MQQQHHLWPQHRYSLLTLAVLACSPLSLAQTVTAQKPPQDDSKVEVIEVTGSRIRRTDLETNTPVVSLGAEEIAKTGTVNISELLNELPSMVPAGGTETSNSNGYAGLSRQDLRGLGSNRTLVLVNGRRHVPSVPGTSEVDISSIPTALIERVDIMTGGASAIYGADAVSGVVNIILKKDFIGTEATASYQVTGAGDGQRWYTSLTHGDHFTDGNGSYSLHTSYQTSDEVEANTRSYVANDLTYIRNTAVDSPTYLVGNRSPLYASSQRVFLLSGRPYQLNADGSPVAMTAEGEAIYGSSTSQLAALTVDAGNANFYTRYHWGRLAVPVDKLNLNLNLSRQLTSAIELTSELKYVSTDSESRTEPLSEYGVTRLARNYPFYSAAQQAEVNRTGQGLLFGGYFPELGRRGADYQYDLYQALVALEGELADTYRWQFSAQHGQTRVNTTTVNDYSQAYWDKQVWGSTGWVWTGTKWSFESSCEAGCAINVFQPLTAENIAALKLDPHTSHARLTQSVLSSSIDGALFELPAGDASIAAGLEHRREKSSDLPSATQLAGLGANNYQAKPLTGNYQVTEAFTEISLPLLSAVPLAKTLEINGAWRSAKYSTAGTSHSWMTGLDWMPFDALKLRISRAKAARAPNITEIFQQESQSRNYVYEVCYSAYREQGSAYRQANCNARGLADPDNYYNDALIVNSGNQQLKAERAYTFSTGLVYAPQQLENLHLTLDYWDINLVDKIGTLNWASIYPNCMDSPTLDNIFCAMIEYQPDLTQINVSYLNLAKHQTRGVDYALEYRIDLPVNGLQMALRSNWSRLLQRDLQSDPNAEISRTLAGMAFPKWRGRTGLTVWNSGWNLSLTAHYIGSQTPDLAGDPSEYAIAETGRLWYLDAGLGYQLTANSSLNLYLSNLSDRETPQVPGANTGGASWEMGYTAGLYTTLGRYYTLSFNHQF
jgi:outer membrane receptor protein involved in Fe transport